MNIQKLVTSKFIRPGVLALKLWPHLSKKVAFDKFYAKVTGSQGRHFSDDEAERLKIIWNEIKTEIES